MGDERKIINVAAGKITRTSTEAINGSQLYSSLKRINQQFRDVHNRINNLNKTLKGLGAAISAATALPQVTKLGKSMLAVATGNYKGANAVAISYSRSNDNGNMVLRLNASVDINSVDAAFGVGLGFQW